MAERGTGRPSTYAGAVDTLLKEEGYAEGDTRAPIRLTEQGKAVAEILKV